jgi:hypothetical protein
MDRIIEPFSDVKTMTWPEYIKKAGILGQLLWIGEIKDHHIGVLKVNHRIMLVVEHADNVITQWDITEAASE